jgi:DNA repair protein RadC
MWCNAEVIQEGPVMNTTPTATGRTYVLQDLDTTMGEDIAEQGYELRLRDMPDADRPREKMLAAGPSSLSVAELVAIIWANGTRKEDVMLMAQRTLREYGEKTVSHETDARRLMIAAGIPLQKAVQLIAAFELGRRYHGEVQGNPVQVRNVDQAFQYLKGMGFSNKEQLRGLYLNSRYQVIHDEIISVGTLTSNIVHPREVFQPAIQHSAVAFIIAHNHPSGVLEPTAADLNVTAQLKAAGELLGISLLDHLIVTNTRCVSIMEDK